MASKEFVQSIQDRMGDECGYGMAVTACEWLNERKPIDPSWGAGDVPRYLRSLGCDDECVECQRLSQECADKADEVWGEMFSHLAMLED